MAQKRRKEKGEACEYGDSCVLSDSGQELILYVTDIPADEEQLNLITGEER